MSKQKKDLSPRCSDGDRGGGEVCSNSAAGIVGKSDFDHGILILESIFPNFSEYFS